MLADLIEAYALDAISREDALREMRLGGYPAARAEALLTLIEGTDAFATLRTLDDASTWGDEGDALVQAIILEIGEG